jgi:serine phosphatase RsbU (regulator of sigma subunit)
VTTLGPIPPLLLDQIAGPELPDAAGTIAVAADGRRVFGRGAAADIRLPDAAVSRAHAAVQRAGTAWVVTDLDSRHGTFVNGNALHADQPEPLADRDQLRIGPFLFRVRLPAALTTPRATALTTVDAEPSTRVQQVPEQELRHVAQHRLDVLIDCAAQINAAPDLDAMAGIALDAAVAGSGFPRAAMIERPAPDGSVAIIARRWRSGTAPTSREVRLLSAAALEQSPVFSRSLLDAASTGRLVRLTHDSPPANAYGQSIVDLGIHSALCAPITFGDSVEAFLYLDARGAESTIQADAAGFVQAIARMCGMALSNIRRQRLEVERAQVHAELSAARHAQQLIMPPPRGQRGWHQYALETRPGRMVAGDLFDVVPLTADEHGPVAVFLGDVTGKGVPAAITMATVQTELRVLLRHEHDPAVIAREVNHRLALRSTDGRFVSLWLGILDPARQEVRFVDAGHGYWLLAHPGKDPAPITSAGGLPLGVDPAAAYTAETAQFLPGSRLLLYSDGVCEQPDPDGTMFGVQKVIETLRGSRTPEEDVQRLRDAVRAHAATDDLADDLTVASSAWVAAG